jgi:hypothetical protein
MRKLLLLLGCVLLLLVAVAAPALAAGGPGGRAPTVAIKPPPPPEGSRLVMNVTEKYTNWEDGGNVGYWALVKALQRVKVWESSPGSYYLIAWYVGTWTTYAGVPSPNCSSEPGAGFGLPVAQAGGSGPYRTWVAFTFDAAGCTQRCGFLGTFDDGGSQADVMLGYYVDPVGGQPLQLGSRHDADTAFFEYFTDIDWDTLVGLSSCWVYRYRTQRLVGVWTPEGGTSQTGDIVVTR